MKIKKLNRQSEKKLVDVSFDILLIMKGLFATGESLLGFIMIFITPVRLDHMIERITHGEDKNFFCHFLLNVGEHFTENAQWVAVIYLLSHGLIKLVTIILLWRRVMWAYPVSIIAIVGFILFQSVEIVAHHSVVMIVATLIDFVVIALIVLEYRQMKGKW